MNVLFSEDEAFYRDLGLSDDVNFSYAFNGCHLYNKEKSFLQRFDIFVCAFYTMPHNVLLTLKFKQLKKPTIICLDGIFDFSNAIKNPMVSKYNVIMHHPILQDYFFCVGKRESLYFSNDATTFNYLPQRVLGKNAMIALPKSKKTLVTTANSAYFDSAEFELLSNLIVDIVEVLTEASIPFSVRIFDARLLRTLENKVGYKLDNDLTPNFEETLVMYSSVITTPSSIALAAMHHERAVALLVYRDSPMFLQAGWLIPSKQVFQAALNSFTALETERMRIQVRVMETYATENNITYLLKNISSKNLEKNVLLKNYINTTMLNMLESKFNFNVEYLFRKMYNKIKKWDFIKTIRLNIK